ncbi:hypothetical protein HPP92_014336 [Vanilla planifolia]|uniref:Uncharacterized protein n=1 Tax=Vanilla planifolia TaxID=51239 RepID=A0A835QWH4_VANPL|nr:hypothetical protein HPP92_014336 [Vanilla planifolia]
MLTVDLMFSLNSPSRAHQSRKAKKRVQRSSTNSASAAPQNHYCGDEEGHRRFLVAYAISIIDVIDHVISLPRQTTSALDSLAPSPVSNRRLHSGVPAGLPLYFSNLVKPIPENEVGRVRWISSVTRSTPTDPRPSLYRSWKTAFFLLGRWAELRSPPVLKDAISDYLFRAWLVSGQPVTDLVSVAVLIRSESRWRWSGGVLFFFSSSSFLLGRQRLLTFLSGVVLMISYTVVVPSRPTSFYSAASPSPGTAYRTAGFGSTSRWYPTGGDANRLAATASASSAGMQMFRQHAAGACGGYKGERFAEAMGRAVRVSITSGTCICQDLWHLGQQSADRPPAMELFMDYTVA